MTRDDDPPDVELIAGLGLFQLRCRLGVQLALARSMTVVCYEITVDEPDDRSHPFANLAIIRLIAREFALQRGVTLLNVGKRTLNGQDDPTVGKDTL